MCKPELKSFPDGIDHAAEFDSDIALIHFKKTDSQHSKHPIRCIEILEKNDTQKIIGLFVLMVQMAMYFSWNGRIKIEDGNCGV